MADRMRVNTGSMRQEAAAFGEDVASLRSVSTVDEAAVSQDSIAHGEVYGKLQGLYREAREEIARRYGKSGDRYQAHQDKINNAANGYDGVESSVALQLKSFHGDNDGTGGTIAPNGVGRIDDIQSPGMNGPYDTTLPDSPGQVVAQMPPGVGHDAPINQGPPPTVAQMPAGVGPDAPYTPTPQPAAPAQGGVSGPYDVHGSGPAQVRPASFVDEPATPPVPLGFTPRSAVNPTNT